MRYRFTEDDGALYVKFRRGKSDRQVQVDAGTIVDLDSRGRVLGVEVIGSDSAWPVDAVIEAFRLEADQATYLREVAEKAVAIPRSRKGKDG